MVTLYISRIRDHRSADIFDLHSILRPMHAWSRHMMDRIDDEAVWLQR